MKRNLLIIGAGIYSAVAYETACDMGIFENIDFVDDGRDETPNGIKVIGKIADIKSLSQNYTDIAVAIGNPSVRLSLIARCEAETDCEIATLISPRAYIAPSATIEKGSVIEPMAVVHSLAKISVGCLLSAGAVVNHASTCSEGVHVDCNAAVAGCVTVPACMKVASGEVFK